MIRFTGRTVAAGWCALSLGLVAATAAYALQEQPKTGRFDPLVIENPEGALGAQPATLESFDAAEAVRSGWESFRTAHGPDWRIYIDRRSGAPLLVEGQGIPWAVDKDTNVDSLEAPARAFLNENKSLVLAGDSELVYSKTASGPMLDSVWQLSFDHVVHGIPVVGERFVLTIGHGNLISFGAPRWSRVDASPIPDLDLGEAKDRLASYLKLTEKDAMDITSKAQLQFLPVPVETKDGAARAPYTGAIGAGYTTALVWRFSVVISGQEGDWLTMVDAHSGKVWAFVDQTEHAQIKGGVHPFSNDGICPEGCEQPNFPMPYAEMATDTTLKPANSSGLYDCSPAGTMMGTRFQGQFMRPGGGVCGLFGQQVTCDSDINLGTNGPTQCSVPAGTSAGNTHAMRDSYYHLTRLAEHAQTWLPNLPWLTSTVEVQIDQDPESFGTCDASWKTLYGERLTYLEGNGQNCRNCGEIAGILMHEWGHGLDYHDLFIQDNPPEAYADITSMMMTHQSCEGRGFLMPFNGSTGRCNGYGNDCLTCSGVREMDWDKRANHVPSTPGGFVQSRCTGGGGPCGREVHCEGYLGGETIWDLVNRDLTAMGVDLPSAWQLVDKLWFVTRYASGGGMWECALPNADGCFSTSLFSRLRNIDDDDGNLANGTPHAAAIFAAFSRHGIACGQASDASNQNYSTCPTVGTVSPTFDIASGTVTLKWAPVAHAVQYRILRNDIGCNWASTTVGTTLGTSYTDSGLGNSFTEYYRVQALGGNSACDAPVSACIAATPEPFAGQLKLSSAKYTCVGTIGLTVIDANIGASTTSVSIQSSTESTPESVTLTQIAPGSDTYTGSITTTTAPPTHDGVLSVTSLDTVTATYLEADDGGGNHNIPHVSTATIDCTPPVITKVQTTAITGTTAKITWATDEPADSTVHYGLTPPPGTTTGVPASVQGHSVPLTGLNECSTYDFSVASKDVVGNQTSDDASGAYYPFTTSKSFSTTYSSADTPKDIPDQFSAGASTAISVPDIHTLQDVNVNVNVQHTFDGDLTFTLIAPTGLKIVLANPHGGSGDNYTNTTFDDEAAVPLGSSPPFTGSFQPDTPLSAADGINTAGTWQLNVVDGSGQDTGQILNWSLQLTYSATSCGSHAVVRSASRVSDSCPSGGPGNANSYWDAGEHVQFKLVLENDGTTALTGVTATATPTTAGVTMDDATASFPDIPAGASVESVSPHLTAHLPTSLACGGTVSFNISVQTNQGTFPGTASDVAGRATNGTGRVLSEGFDNGIPATWSIVNGGTDANAGSTWTASNPGVRTIAPPMKVPIVTIDSDAAAPGELMDDSLQSPVLNLSTATSAVLQFDEFFRWFPGGLNETADVDVRSSITGGSWVNVLRQQGVSSANPAHQSVNISAQAAGAADAQLRFHYWNGQSEEYWQVDNVTVDTSAPGSCDMPTCVAAAGGAKPVPDGVFGAAMKASRGNAAGTTIAVTWDAATCPSADNHILYGNLASVASVTVVGAVCDLGTSGSASWTSVPAGNLWFVVVGDDNATIEASWGTDGVGGQRGGTATSGQCGLTTRDNSGTCP